jgi:hypothetical protein
LIFHMIVWHIQEDRMHKKLKLKQGVQNSEGNYLQNSFLFSCHHQMPSAPALTHCHGEEATELYLQDQGTSWNIVKAERKFVPRT